MKIRYKLNTQFSLFLTGFTAILLISILAFIYVNNVSQIKKKAEREFSYYLSRFQDEFLDQINSCKLEMYPLLNSSPPFHSDLDMIITAYPLKYIALGFGDPYSGTVRAIPLKLYGGEIITKIDTLAFSPMYKNPVLSRYGRSIDISFSHPADSNMHIYARVALDYVVDQILFDLQLPPVFTSFLTNSNFTILHSSSSHDLGSQFNQLFAEPGALFPSPCYSSTLAWQGSQLPYGLVLFLQKNLRPEFNVLHRTLIGLGIFILILLCIVLLIVKIIAGRFAASLEKITRVTHQVSEGDFGQKIKLERRDELGDLIRAFNQMVDRLQKNYHALEKTNKALEKNLDELSRARAELSQKQRLALIGETLSKISHEIQNKIGGVSIWVQNLKTIAADDPDISMYTFEMEQSLDSFMQMLSNFKRFYREPSLDMTVFDIVKLVDDAIWPFVTDAESRAIKLEAEYENKIYITADREQLLDVLSNLFMNALYYSPDGGTIKYTVFSLEGYCKITVCDDGPGIRKKDQDKIFHPFYTTKTSGSGLGLAIASSVIKAHNGRISVHNKSGHGACFTLLIPCKSDKD